VHEQFWERLTGLPREETARRAKCRYLAESDSFVVPLLSTDYLVDPARRTVRAAEVSEDRPAGYLQQLCLLAYLVDAKDLPLADRLVSAERLDPGGFFFRGSHRLAVEKLASEFGPDPQLLRRVGQVLNAIPQTFGDVSMELCVLPRIPVTLVIWAADEEFPARASVLFDQSATEQLPLDVLFAIGALTIDGVLSIVKTIT
jgi:hypothetical protein